MKNVKVWIAHNPFTGIKRPWEVYFQVEGRAARVVASCATEAGAQKSLKSLVKRCDGMYTIA